MTWVKLGTTHNRINGLNVDLVWLSRALWTFMSANMTLTFQRTCSQLIGCEEANGLELWRFLYFQNQGGAEQVQIVDRAAFHAFPKCQSPEHIPHDLG